MTKFAFFDLDKTLYSGWSTDDFNHFMVDSGYGSKQMLTAERERVSKLFAAGAYGYNELSEAIVILGIKLLAGMNREKILELEDEFIKVAKQLYSYTYPLIHLLQHEGFICYLVSAAPVPPVEAWARELNMPFFASEAEMKNFRYTGNMKLFVNGEVKRKKIGEVLDGAEQPTYVLSFGDSIGDLALLEAANEAFVVHPFEEKMVSIVKDKGYHLVEDTTILGAVSQVLKEQHIHS